MYETLEEELIRRAHWALKEHGKDGHIPKALTLSVEAIDQITDVEARSGRGMSMSGFHIALVAETLLICVTSNKRSNCGVDVYTRHPRGLSDLDEGLAEVAVLPTLRKLMVLQDLADA